MVSLLLASFFTGSTFAESYWTFATLRFFCGMGGSGIDIASFVWSEKHQACVQYSDQLTWFCFQASKPSGQSTESRLASSSQCFILSARQRSACSPTLYEIGKRSN